ncbi:MAG: alpha/beta hydrolase [Lachnospiraceae bacterium]|nr:alpha/beta hydrolase [Lachnospiraceae bacterium]
MKDYKEKNFLFGDNNFNERMEKEVAPLLQQVKEGDFLGYDGKTIHYYYLINSEEKASVVISHGFCEFFPKYHEMTYYFYEAGYSVFFVEHRGHGYSYRETEELDRVHATRFQSYVDDLKLFVDGVVKKESLSQKLYLYSHSMGGCIAALYLEQYPKDFEKAILSSPMMQLNFRGTSPLAVKVLMLWSTIAHWNEKYLPGQHGFDGINTYPNCSAQSEVRHNYLFEFKKKNKNYQMNGGTYGWCKESLKAMKQVINDAAKITTPTILFQAGLDTMVEPGGQNKFLQNNPNIKKYVYPDSKHEIFNAYDSDRKQYYMQVLDFYHGEEA